MSDQLPPPPPPPPPVVVQGPKRGPGRPKGSKDKAPRKVEPSDKILRHRTDPSGTAAPKSSRAEYDRQLLEQNLSQKDWLAVYQAFGDSGSPAVIAEKVKLERRQVLHLLDYGIMRIGLRPIREHATDYAEVNQRVESLIGKSQKQALTKVERTEALPDVKEAATDRAVRETVAAQSALLAAVKTSDVLLRYINKLAEKLQTEESELFIPEQITMGTLETLSKVANNLSNAIGKAVEQSRLTAGEPTQNVALSIGAFVAELNREELKAYVLTRQLPSHVRIRGGSRDTVESKRNVIDTTTDKPESDG